MSIERNARTPIPRREQSLSVEQEVTFIIMKVDAHGKQTYLSDVIEDRLWDAVKRGVQFDASTVFTGWAHSHLNTSVVTVSREVASAIQSLARHSSDILYAVERTTSYRVAKSAKMSLVF